MEIIGWIRQGDMAACGSLVAEGEQFCRGNGRPYAFQGARLACKRNCVIAEGYAHFRINGRGRVSHGMKTSGGCPLISTLNDIDGVGNKSGATIPTSFFLNANGEWGAEQKTQTNEAVYDEQTKLIAPPIEGLPYYIETMDGRTLAGRVGADGLLPRIDTAVEDEYSVLWGDEALAKLSERQQHA